MILSFRIRTTQYGTSLDERLGSVWVVVRAKNGEASVFYPTRAVSTVLARTPGTLAASTLVSHLSFLLSS
jgi:hypothetical protein